MTHTTKKSQATMPMGPMLVREDVARLPDNSLAFAGDAMSRDFALRQDRADIDCVGMPCRARAMGGDR